MKFWKYQGLGNDFIILLASQRPKTLAEDPSDLPRLAEALCNRRLGIGADGVLLVDQLETGHWRMVVYNSDGSRPEMCGNGLRCVARFLCDEGLIEDLEFDIQTDAGLRPVRISEDMIEVDMGAITITDRKNVSLKSRSFTGLTLDAGNPHFVLFGEWNGSEPERFGGALAVHPDFTEGVNVSFASVIKPNVIRLQVWERGCGLTMACGTGACATAVASWKEGICSPDTVEVNLPGGQLRVSGGPDRVLMTGPATKTFEGHLTLT